MKDESVGPDIVEFERSLRERLGEGAIR